MSVLWLMGHANAYGMGLGGSLVVEASVLAPVSASSLPGIPLWSCTQGGGGVGPSRTLMSDSRWRVIENRHSIALSCVVVAVNKTWFS